MSTISFHRKHVPAISTDWKEGKYWDLWMIVHFFSGVTIGCAMPFVVVSEGMLYGIAFAGMIAWELIEYFFDVHEVIENRILDVLFGIAGVGLVATYITPSLSDAGRGIALLVSIIILATLEFFGWRAYRKRLAS